MTGANGKHAGGRPCKYPNTTDGLAAFTLDASGAAEELRRQDKSFNCVTMGRKLGMTRQTLYAILNRGEIWNQAYSDAYLDVYLNPDLWNK